MSPKRNFFTRPVLPVCLILFVLLFEACADKIKTDLIGYRALDEGLTTSNKVIEEQTAARIMSLQDKLNDPKTAEKAKTWYPKAQFIRALSKEINDYIEKLKSDLKHEAGLKEHDGDEVFRESDKNAVMRLFVKQKKGEELYEKLLSYKSNILSVDADLTAAFKGAILLTTQSFDISYKKQFTKTFFDDIPVAAALPILSKFQNNVRIIETRTVEFCDNKIGSRYGHGF